MDRDTIQFSSDIDSSQLFSPKHRKFGALKKVSGQLKRIWSGKDYGVSSKSGSPRILVVDDEESICFSMS